MMDSIDKIEKHLNPYTEKQLAKINGLVKDKKTIIVKDGIIQEDLDNPDYLYLSQKD